MSDSSDSQMDSEVETTQTDFNQSQWERERDEDRESLRLLREMHLQALERLLVEIEDVELRTTFSKNGLRARKERMREHLRNMEKAHVLFRQACMIATNEIFEVAESRFIDAIAWIDDRLDELCRAEPGGMERSGFQRGEVNANSSTYPHFPSVIRVETAQPPQIGTFNGNPADWPAFRDLFIAEVHNKDFEPVTKLRLLQEACIEKAHETLGPWQPTGDNYKVAWDLMLAAFNDEYHVIHGILGKLFAVQRQEKESHNSLKVVFNSMSNGLRQLQAVSSDPQVILDQMCIHISKQRLPKQTLDSWEQHRNRHEAKELPTCREFLKFLETKAKGRREFETEANWANQSTAGGKPKGDTNSGRFKPYEKNASRDKLYQPSRNESGGSGRITECIVQGCKQAHPAWRCESFAKLPYAERNELARVHKLCRCCLSPGHFSFACTRNGCSKCPEAKFKHHYKLCPKSDDAKSGASAAKRETEASTKKD